MIMSHSIAWWHRAFWCKQFGALMAFLLTVPILCQDCGWLQLWRGKWWTRDRFKDNGTRRTPITPNSTDHSMACPWALQGRWWGRQWRWDDDDNVVRIDEEWVGESHCAMVRGTKGKKNWNQSILYLYVIMYAVVRLNGGIYTSWRGLQIQAGWWRLLQSIGCAA